ncbi:MAG: putative nucleotidyltransferase substrate binding domain-containing protein, partial [Campylobacterota bacterium]
RFCEHLDIEYFQKGTFLIDNNTQEEKLYFIIKGKVQEIEPKTKEVISIYNKTEFFDPLALIEHRVKNHFYCLQECICYTVDKDIFLKTVYANKKLEHFFFQSISQKLGTSLTDDQNKELANFMVARVSDAFLQKPLSVGYNTSIHDAVKFMKDHAISSLLVTDNKGFYGIATDTDFREKVILEKLSYDEPVGNISTFGLISVHEDDFLFNAQILMTRHNIKRVLVKDKDENITGILDQISLTSFFSSHTYSIANEIDMAADIEELKKASKKFIRIIQSLFAKGVKVRYIANLLNELNKKLFEKIFILLAPTQLIHHSALLVMGSEGRGEQILRTDQDNALIISDRCPVPKDQIEKFSKQFTQALLDFGYPECPGNIMLSNPYWNRTQQGFNDLIDTWLKRKDDEDFMHLAIFVDASCIAGDERLLKEVKKHLFTSIEDSAFFTSKFASLALTFSTPLGLFNDFVTNKDEHKDELDIKKGGIFPLVQGIRTLALQNGITQTNTNARVNALRKQKVLDEEFAKELIESFNFLNTLRLKAGLQKLDEGEEVDNYVNPKYMSTIERDMLKDSFKIVNRFKKYMTTQFRLEYV